MLRRARRLAAAALAVSIAGCASRAEPPVVTPPVLRSKARTQPLSPGEAIVAFARVYGAVRYFHPSDAAAEADWNTIAATGVAAVHDATTYGELAATLQAVFGPLTHGMEIWVDPEPAPPPPQRPPRSAGLVYWQHQGYEGTPISLFQPPYSSVRITPKTRYERRFAEEPDPAAPLETALAGPVHLRLPLTLPQAVATATPPTPLRDTPVLDTTDISELAVREAIMVDVWSTLRHFYPYQAEVSVPWDDVLLEALERTRDDASVEDVVDSIRTLTRALVDGHARVERTGKRGRGWLPVRLECMGEDVVVTASNTAQLQPGDLVQRIDGAEAREHLGAIADRLSGTERWRTFRACTWEGAQGAFGAEVTLEVQTDGQTDGQTVPISLRYSEHAVVPPARPEAFTRLDDGVLYVDLTRLSWTDLKPRREELAAAPGIVFDMRGYPVHNDDILDLLLEREEDAEWMHVPRFIRPGGTPVSYAHLGWQRTPSPPHIDAPVVFLTSAAAISYAESILAYVQTHALGTIIGSPTAGANGDIVRHDSLAGFYVVFSGMRVTRHDGTPFHNEGVAPEVRVSPTPAGIRAGNDESLAAGLERVRQDIAARSVAP